LIFSRPWLQHDLSQVLKVGMPESNLAEDDEPMESPDPVQDGPAGAVSKSAE